jgi:hypothetical protein
MYPKSRSVAAVELCAIVNWPFSTLWIYTPVADAALAVKACKNGTDKAEQLAALTKVVVEEAVKATVPTALDRPVASSRMAEEMRVGSFSLLPGIYISGTRTWTGLRLHLSNRTN